jgi:hypothetical protein
MHARIAVTVVCLGAIAAASALAIGSYLGDEDAASTPSTVAHEPSGCGGWTAARMPITSMVDIAATSTDDLWLLTRRGVYHFDGCTWRAHAPFSTLAGLVIEWETISIDPDGAVVITGESPAGPEKQVGCVIYNEFPAKRRSYRYVSGASTWQEIPGRPRTTPDRELGQRELAPDRSIIATATVHEPAVTVYAIVEATERIDVRDAYGRSLDFANRTSSELWRRVAGVWAPLIVRPPDPLPTSRESLNTLPVPGDIYATAIDDDDPRDVWAVGYRSDMMPDIAHYDGHHWTSHRGRFRSDIQYHLSAVQAARSDDVWVVGTWGTVLHFDGTSWTMLPEPSFYDLAEVVVLPGFVRVTDLAGGVFWRTN